LNEKPSLSPSKNDVKRKRESVSLNIGANTGRSSPEGLGKETRRYALEFFGEDFQKGIPRAWENKSLK